MKQRDSLSITGVEFLYILELQLLNYPTLWVLHAKPHIIPSFYYLDPFRESILLGVFLACWRSEFRDLQLGRKEIVRFHLYDRSFVPVRSICLSPRNVPKQCPTELNKAVDRARDELFVRLERIENLRCIDRERYSSDTLFATVSVLL